MNTLDVLILLALAGGIVRGFSTGVIRQVASLVGLVLAFLLAVRLMKPVGHVVVGSLGVSEAVGPLLGFILVFLVVEVGVYALVRLVEALVGALKLTVLNRVMGGAAGGVKVGIALSVLFLFLGGLGLPDEHLRENSALFAPVASVLPTAWSYVEGVMPEVEQLSDKFSHQIEAQLPESE
jgi:membrane protein required for colicin V production